MLVVISDLHFEEEASCHIPADGDEPAVHFSRNLTRRAYRLAITNLAAEARRNGVKRLDLVLAGDIFDIHRTGLWFRDNPQRIRPYQHMDTADPKLEAKVLEILEAICREQNVTEVLQEFQQLAAGYYWDGDWQEFPAPEGIRLHYIPGNHDRLLNATPAIRRRIRELLGLSPSPEPFPRACLFPAERTLVRHGHEYDHFNFSADHRSTKEFPVDLPVKDYAAPTFGDFITVDVASRLPHLFREHYGESTIRTGNRHRAIYLRLLEFDDLRPLSAMLHYLLSMPETDMTPERVWKLIEPVLQKLLDEVHNAPYLRQWLRRLTPTWWSAPFDSVQMLAIRIALSLRVWRWRIPLRFARFLANRAVNRYGKAAATEKFAVRESSIGNGDCLFVVAGHTHNPRLNLLVNNDKGERHYIDTGTWRNQVPAAPDFKTFGRLKALTYVVIYGPDEDRGNPPEDGKIASVDFWSGVTQRWTRS